jgi:hypothetical protein
MGGADTSPTSFIVHFVDLHRTGDRSARWTRVVDA